MKLSIVTPTYNREELLPTLYHSILQNHEKSNVSVEWLIMDDGSTDDTKERLLQWQKEEKIAINYFFHENQGKMKSINELIPKTQGDLIIECDSDDYFTPNAFEEIAKVYEENKKRTDIYAFAFLKYDQNGKNMGNNFPEGIHTSNMFDLYFKQGVEGEKALVFFSTIRKQFCYQLEKEERFVTEARMFHKMDELYQIKCYNKPIMICEYQEHGYTKNSKKLFLENPNGYFEYFKEILQSDMRQVTFSKRLYVMKHYILFKKLSKRKNKIREIEGFLNKFLYLLLFIPGTFKTKQWIK